MSEKNIEAYPFTPPGIGFSKPRQIGFLGGWRRGVLKCNTVAARVATEVSDLFKESKSASVCQRGRIGERECASVYKKIETQCASL